jgi:cytochrome P450
MSLFHIADVLEQRLYLRFFLYPLRMYKTCAPLPSQNSHLIDSVMTGYKVPKGTWFNVSVYALHNDPRVWGGDVATFLPERWLTEDPVAAKKAKSSFFGFGDGPRVCPGNRFALTEAKMALVRIYQNFSLELRSGQVSCAISSCSSIDTVQPVR